jgi:hypothetical protein
MPSQFFWKINDTKICNKMAVTKLEMPIRHICGNCAAIDQLLTDDNDRKYCGCCGKEKYQGFYIPAPAAEKIKEKFTHNKRRMAMAEYSSPCMADELTDEQLFNLIPTDTRPVNPSEGDWYKTVDNKGNPTSFNFYLYGRWYRITPETDLQ